MEDQMICIYCVYQDILKAIGHTEDSPCKGRCAEVMTIAIVAALFFGGNISHPSSIQFWQNKKAKIRLGILAFFFAVISWI